MDLPVAIERQPTVSTCGPTCLHALYSYYGDPAPLGQLIDEVPVLEDGGTLAVLLASHALQRGYDAKIYTYNLQVFDPSWFALDRAALRSKLEAQAEHKKDAKLRMATRAYCQYLDLGGELLLEELTPSLVAQYLSRNRPILAGLSATYLYRTPREFGELCDFDDVRGVPSGHFVLVTGYREEEDQFLIMDPLHPNPLSPEPRYAVDIHRFTNAVLLGVVTYDANLLIIEPRAS
jgi:hypothetical protein